MICTSYFAKLKTLPSNVIPISICGKAPPGYHGPQYKKLAPKYEFFQKWKTLRESDPGEAERYYIECYRQQVLRPLDVYRVLNELHAMIPYFIRDRMHLPVWEDPDLHLCLVCYEKPSDFCHRHLVSAWFSQHGIPCSEFK